MAQVEALTLTTLLLHVRSRLLESLGRPATDENRAALMDLWRVCLTIHDLAESRREQAYVALMERMIDAVADYSSYGKPESVHWAHLIPSVQDIKAAAHDS
jgi:hypothetical protein